MMFNHCKPFMEEARTLVLQNHSMYDLIIVSKMAIMLEGFEFNKQKEISWS